MHPKTHAERMTVEEYLRMERAAEFCHIYLDGVVTLRPGENWAHGGISGNLAGLLHRQLRAAPCHLFVKATRVYSGPPGPEALGGTVGMFSYPDFGVVWGKPAHPDYDPDTLTNPTAVIEVLAPDTEAFDRGKKFHRFREWNPTLSDYLLVAQDRPSVDHFRRLPGDQWSLRFYEGRSATVEIASIGVTLRLEDLYDDVNFPDVADEPLVVHPAETPNS